MSRLADAQPLDRPVILQGIVCRGFGRGSKMLGIPTANIPVETCGADMDSVKTGVYAGWASIDGGDPYKTVMSIGWNPYFKNTQKTIEPHLLHEFGEDFYDAHLKLAITAYLRPELDFPDLDSLIKAIHADIQVGHELLAQDAHASQREQARGTAAEIEQARAADAARRTAREAAGAAPVAAAELAASPEGRSG